MRLIAMYMSSSLMKNLGFVCCEDWWNASLVSNRNLSVC
jgi:hypothetical protein